MPPVIAAITFADGHLEHLSCEDVKVAESGALLLIDDPHLWRISRAYSAAWWRECVITTRSEYGPPAC